MAPHNHIPDDKRGFFGTDDVGHFYEEVRGITKVNPYGEDRQDVIKSSVAVGDRLVLKQAVECEDSPISVFTESGREIGYLLKSVGKDIVKSMKVGHRYAAVVDEILEWQPFEGHTHYGVSALIVDAAPGATNDQLKGYVVESFGTDVSSHILKCFGI